MTDAIIWTEKFPETDRTAFENSYIEDYVTLHVPKASLDKYKAIAPWKNFKEIVGIYEVDPQLSENKCAIPSISIVGGKLTFGCETEGVTYHYDVSSSFNKKGEGNGIELANTYSIKVYASKDGYYDSETVTEEITLDAPNYDRNGDNKINVADIMSIINMMLAGK